MGKRRATVITVYFWYNFIIIYTLHWGTNAERFCYASVGFLTVFFFFVFIELSIDYEDVMPQNPLKIYFLVAAQSNYL